MEPGTDTRTFQEEAVQMLHGLSDDEVCPPCRSLLFIKTLSKVEPYVTYVQLHL